MALMVLGYSDISFYRKKEELIMSREEILKKITDICRDVFEDETLVIDDDTTASDVDGWDSLTHLSLINEIENEFNIKFTLGEITGSKNMGELIDVIEKHFL